MPAVRYTSWPARRNEGLSASSMISSGLYQVVRRLNLREEQNANSSPSKRATVSPFLKAQACRSLANLSEQQITDRMSQWCR